MFVNARSVLNNLKLKELRLYAEDKKLDIIGIAESWLNDNVADNEIAIDNFTVYRKDRAVVKDGKGGGVILYVKNTLLSTECVDLNNLCNESIWCKIITDNNIETFVGVVYKSPNASRNEVNSILSMLRSVANTHILVMGDFNYPGIDWDMLTSDSLGEEFLDLVQDNFWTQHVLTPTRGLNVLDLILTSEEGMIDNVTVNEHLSNSDHNILLFNLVLKTTTHTSKQIKYNFNRGDYTGMNNLLKSVDWNKEFANCDPDNMWEKFNEIVLSAIDKFVPIRSNKKFKHPRWMTKKARKARKRKAKMWKRFKASKTYNDEVEYKKSLNIATSEYKKAVYNFETNLAKDVKQNPKAFYAYGRSKSKTKDKVCPLKDDQGNIAVNDADICKVLNTYFSSVFTHENITTTNDEFPSLKQIFTGDQNDMLQDIEITEELVRTKLGKLCLNKAPGVDGLVPRVLVETAGSISKPLCMIFRASLDTGIVPVDWKRANVIALFKKGRKDSPGNYRPVSLTSQVCKLLETIIKEYINDHLSKYNLIKDSQHGFMKQKSCLTNLLEFLNYTHDHVDKGNPVDVVYLDFQKAFDKVPHRRLLFKVRAHGIGGKIEKWINNWLSNRQQRVVLNDTVSDWSNVLSGVPQGSVLGPLLFIIYINDIDDAVINKLSKFADDTKVYGVVSTQEQIKQMRQDLENLYNWSQDWLMLFNLDKCKVMHFGKHNDKELYFMGNTCLSPVVEEKDLGVIIQDDLKISKQCAKAVKTANRILGMISRTFILKSREIILQLYKSLVRPHLENCVQAWRPHLKKDIDLLEKVQRRATRMIDSFRNFSYEDRLIKLNLTTLETRRLRGDLIEVFKMYKGFDNVNMHDYFTLSVNNLRGNSCKLFKPRINTDVGKFSFANRVINEWNLLSDDILSCCTVDKFKNKLDHYFKNGRGLT